MQIKQTPVSFKAGPDDGLAEGEFLVYPSTFTRTPDAYGDVIAKGAFLDTIEQWKTSGNTLPGLFGHRMDDPDFYVAGAIDMGEDDHGWWVKGAFDLDSPKGPQVYRLVKGKRLTQLSFAFDTLEDGTVTLDNGDQARELRKVHVHEFSFVPIGANQDTSVVAIKALVEQVVAEAEVKAGRAISAKNESTLREAVDKIAAAAGDIKNVLSVLDDGEPTDAGKASGTTNANAEEPSRANAEEPKSHPSARTRLQIELATAELDILNGKG
ncbi:HK97 family phage prohead protease [Agrococcus sp. SL85]|uniref:HK97 family phage prohead protease n=1 Tax=Agrococcus sp. SL85 TaxID=2995141 RepID=UPI00226CB69F|nr:HK97 family phage prohead protease [Agrococcus sp. SL85]WAC65176.1 HK97 family phage prohead protease [Agrococcus sp. SL85]